MNRMLVREKIRKRKKKKDINNIKEKLEKQELK